MAQLTGDYARAAALHGASLPLFREIEAQNNGIAWALVGLGDVALAQGDLTAATTRFTASLPVFQQGATRAVLVCGGAGRRGGAGRSTGAGGAAMGRDGGGAGTVGQTRGTGKSGDV